MKHTGKRMLSLLLCLLLVAGLAAGCGGTEEDPMSATSKTNGESGVSTLPTDDDGQTIDPTGNLEDPQNTTHSDTDNGQGTPAEGGTKGTTVSNLKEKTVKVGNVTVHSAQEPYVSGGQLPITVLLPYTKDAADMNRQAFASYYQKKTGMRVTYNYYKGSDIFVLTQTMLNSGNLPDIFFSVPVGFTCAKVAKYGKEGFFADLTNRMKTWAPHAYDAIHSTEHSYAKAVAYAPGKVYSLPSIHPSAKEGGQVSLMEERQVMINMAWLDELGLKVPQTTDEFYKVAKAFTEEDPDGNGKDDTYGFGTSLWSPQLWNPWGLGMSWYYTGTVTEKGEVLSGLLTDQFREGCRFYNRMWKEGIFCKQMVGAEGSTLKSAVHKTGMVSMAYVDSVLSDSELKDWAAIAWPKGSNVGNFKAGISQPCQLDCFENMVFISAKTKSPEACLRWLDYFYTPDGAMLWHYGPAGKAYTKVGNKYKLGKNVGKLAADQKAICSFSLMDPCNILSRNSSELNTREKYGVRIQNEVNKANRVGKYNFSKLVQLSTEDQRKQIENLKEPGDIQWGYKAIRGEVNVETDWNSYKTAHSGDYAKWKKIYQDIFNKFER